MAAGSAAPASAPVAAPVAAAAYTSHSRAIPGEEDYGKDEYDDAEEPPPNPAAALAGLIQQRTGQGPALPSRAPVSPVQYTPEASDDEAPPPMPQRPDATPPRTYEEPPARGMMASPTQSQRNGHYDDEEPAPSPQGFHLYNIHEMISHMGRNKKMPTTLGLNVARGVIMIAPQKEKDGPSREWTAEKLSHYSIEGKHVFMELVRPSKSIDFHAGSKDTAQEIVSSLGDLAGAARASGLKEVVAAATGTGQKKGRMLYEFMAQADDEVSVAVDDEVLVIDDTQSAEWWVVRRLKTGKEGSVPSSYVEITGNLSSGTRNSGLSVIEQNRLEEERITREAARSSSRDDRRSDRQDRQEQRAVSGPVKPDGGKVRTWTDRSGTFKVEAEFLGLKDGKIHLHKSNGVKIAVPAAKMSSDDLEYVERRTGISLDEEKPLSDLKRKGQDRHPERDQSAAASRSTGGAAIQSSEQQGYDWFDFFLACGVSPQICERYAQIFTKDQMGEENMPDINASLLRTLGIKEGDILRVMKHLDEKYNRSKAVPGAATDNGEVDGGLFSGPDGGLRNNTRKGRPAPAVQTNDTVDPRAFEQNNIKKDQPTERAQSSRPAASGFDDDAWDVKPARTAGSTAPTAAPQPQRPMPTGAMQELSLLSPPLQPTPAPQPAVSAAPPLQPQATGADPSFFDQLARPSTNPPPQQTMARQRPQASGFGNQSSMIPPAPQRPGSAPFPQSNGALPPALMPQRTGLPQIAPPGQSMAEISQQRMMQQMYPQQTGFGYGQPNGGIMPQPTGFGQFPQQTGYGQPQQFMQPLQAQPTGFQPQYLQPQPTGNPFGDSARAPFTPMPPQQTGFPAPLQPQQTGFQPSFPVLQPQPTGFGGFGVPALQPQPTGMNGFGYQQGFGQQPYQAPSQLPQMQQQQIPAPLMPQKTGPAPPVRFGTTPKLTAQPTGRRANLSSASKFSSPLSSFEQHADLT